MVLPFFLFGTSRATTSEFDEGGCLGLYWCSSNARVFASPQFVLPERIFSPARLPTLLGWLKQ